LACSSWHWLRSRANLWARARSCRMTGLMLAVPFFANNLVLTVIAATRKFHGPCSTRYLRLCPCDGPWHLTIPSGQSETGSVVSNLHRANEKLFARHAVIMDPFRSLTSLLQLLYRARLVRLAVLPKTEEQRQARLNYSRPNLDFG
jgi:hypothetical protein